MSFDALADAVMVVHLAFIVFVAVGGLLVWRWRRLVWLHVPAMAWGVGIIAVGYECPLTHLELWLRHRAGGGGYDGGFVDRYVEDVLYPDELTPLLRTLAAVLVVIGYVMCFRTGGFRRSPSIRPRAGAAT